MNILPFVTALLMVLAILVFTKFQSFKTLIGVQEKFVALMKAEEVFIFNEIERNKYENEHGIKEEEEPGEEAAKTSKKKAGTGTAKLSWVLFISNEDKSTQKFQTVYMITKRLITLLYQDQPFFQKMVKERGDFLDDLLTKLKERASQPEYEIKRVADFAKVDLGDVGLSEVFAKMLQGSKIPKEALEQSNSTIIADPTKEYVSLEDYVTTDKDNKIRLYLAPPVLLQAIFEDEKLVEEILEERNGLFNYLNPLQGKALEEEKKQATEEFKRLFDSKIPKQFDPSLFDFSVTKTRPRKV